MEKSFEEFRQEVFSRGNRKEHKVKGSVGVYDMYKHIRRNGWYNIGRPVTEKEFYAIVRGVNKLLADEIALGHTVVFPERMGKLEMRKLKRGAFLVDNKLKITYPVNWNDTLRLWYEDEEARKKKTLIRNENEWVYYVKYCKWHANYENKEFYQFKLNSFIKWAMRDNIKSGKTDTIW